MEAFSDVLGDGQQEWPLTADVRTRLLRTARELEFDSPGFPLVPELHCSVSEN